MSIKDLTNQRFERLTVIELSGQDKHGHALWLCKCDCGNEKIIMSSNLIRGLTKSCGCLQDESRTKHNMLNTRIYKIWEEMKCRCFNKNYKRYHDWGGRGIKVCDEWKNSFQAFYDWSMKHGYKDNLSIDRIDNDGNYEPSNCRWATCKEQNRNKRNNRLITYKGETHCLSEWVEILNLSKSAIEGRLKRGWSVEKTFTTEVKRG